MIILIPFLAFSSPPLPLSFPSLPFTSLHFPSLPFASLLPSLPFPPLLHLLPPPLLFSPSPPLLSLFLSSLPLTLSCASLTSLNLLPTLTWYQSRTTERGWFWRLKWRRRSKDSSKQATGKKLSHSPLFLLDSACKGTRSRAKILDCSEIWCASRAVYILRGSPIGFTIVFLAIWGRFGPHFKPTRLRIVVLGYAVILVVLIRTVCTGYWFQICKF